MLSSRCFSPTAALIHSLLKTGRLRRHKHARADSMPTRSLIRANYVHTTSTTSCTTNAHVHIYLITYPSQIPHQDQPAHFSSVSRQHQLRDAHAISLLPVLAGAASDHTAMHYLFLSQLTHSSMPNAFLRLITGAAGRWRGHAEAAPPAEHDGSPPHAAPARACVPAQATQVTQRQRRSTARKAGK